MFTEKDLTIRSTLSELINRVYAEIRQLNCEAIQLNKARTVDEMEIVVDLFAKHIFIWQVRIQDVGARCWIKMRNSNAL